MDKQNILVMLGTHPKNFDRLTKKIDEIALKNRNLKFFALIANTTLEPENISWARYIPIKELEKKIAASDIVITQGGSGTAGLAIKHQKKLIIFPRKKEYKEHTDNHQVEFAHAVQKKFGAYAVEDEKKLEETIKKALKSTAKTTKEQSKIPKIIQEFIDKNF
jgi:UDP-N-acetylglucosamine transferase subunit ALG13